MIFMRSGLCYWLKVWQVPVASRQSRGKPIVNLLNIGPDDEIASVVPVREFSDDRFLLFCTRGGQGQEDAAFCVRKRPLRRSHRHQHPRG